MRKRSIFWWVFVSPFVVARNLWAARKARKFILRKYKENPELFEKWNRTEVQGVIVPEKDPVDHGKYSITGQPLDD